VPRASSWPASPRHGAPTTHACPAPPRTHRATAPLAWPARARAASSASELKCLRVLSTAGRQSMQAQHPPLGAASRQEQPAYRCMIGQPLPCAAVPTLRPPPTTTCVPCRTGFAVNTNPKAARVGSCVRCQVLGCASCPGSNPATCSRCATGLQLQRSSKQTRCIKL